LGENNIAIVKVVADNNQNYLSNGDELKTFLNRIRVDANLYDTSISKWSIERCGGVEAQSIALGIPTVNGSVNVPFDIDKDWQVDNLLAKGSTVYYVVKAVVNSLSSTAGGSSIQIDLNNLDAGWLSDQSVANFVWQDSYEAERKYYMWLPVKRISGVKISN
jgi:hypothetical protein